MGEFVVALCISLSWVAVVGLDSSVGGSKIGLGVSFVSSRTEIYSEFILSILKIDE
jgi:hypothetical protein